MNTIFFPIVLLVKFGHINIIMSSRDRAVRFLKGFISWTRNHHADPRTVTKGLPDCKPDYSRLKRFV